MAQNLKQKHMKDPYYKMGFAQKVPLFAALCAGLLALTKFALFLLTGSFIVALSAWDSAIDVVVSLVNRKVLQFSRLEADRNHPYGHGRIESIAALGQGCLIAGGALIIIISSLKQIYNEALFSAQEPLIGNFWYVLFFVCNAFLSYFLARWLKKHANLLNSPALFADSEHYKIDFMTNIASGIGVFIVLIIKNSFIDPTVASVFAIYIIYRAFALIKNSLNELMDHDISESIKEKIYSAIKVVDARIVDIHRFRGRKSGHKYFLDFHVTLPQQLSFDEVHVIIENIENFISLEFDADVIVHADPDEVRS